MRSSRVQEVTPELRMQRLAVGKAAGMPSFRVRRCDMCGNEDANCFEVTMGSDPAVTYTFDCFECAIQRLAPVCAHCRCRVVGHGVEIERPSGEVLLCCAFCARWGEVGREPDDEPAVQVDSGLEHS